MMQSGEARYRLRLGKANVQAVHDRREHLAIEEMRERSDGLRRIRNETM
jgi:hypothetical protein